MPGRKKNQKIPKKRKKHIKRNKGRGKGKGKDPVRLYNMEIVPYGQTLFWSFAPTPQLLHEEIKRTLPHLTPTHIEPDTRAHCEIFNYEGSWFPVIWVSQPDKPWLIAHELEHYVHWLLGLRGLTYNDSSEEAYAYLISFIMEMMIESRRPNRYS